MIRLENYTSAAHNVGYYSDLCCGISMGLSYLHISSVWCCCVLYWWAGWVSIIGQRHASFYRSAHDSMRSSIVIIILGVVHRAPTSSLFFGFKYKVGALVG